VKTHCSCHRAGTRTLRDRRHKEHTDGPSPPARHGRDAVARRYPHFTSRPIGILSLTDTALAILPSDPWSHHRRCLSVEYWVAAACCFRRARPVRPRRLSPRLTPKAKRPWQIARRVRFARYLQRRSEAPQRVRRVCRSLSRSPVKTHRRPYRRSASREALTPWLDAPTDLAPLGTVPRRGLVSSGRSLRPSTRASRRRRGDRESPAISIIVCTRRRLGGLSTHLAGDANPVASFRWQRNVAPLRHSCCPRTRRRSG
jgi:hypothetical protein